MPPRRSGPAGDALDERNRDAAFVDHPSNDERCRVTAQKPGPGSVVEEYGEVELWCVVRVPRVVGMKPYAAEDRLFAAGLDSRFTNEPADYELSRCRVGRQSRSGTARPDATVRLRLHCVKPKPKPKPAPEPTRDCDPNCAGACLKPDAYDYDCAGGSGDGPEYTGPVAVVGDDHYDLNRDLDKLACEDS